MTPSTTRRDTQTPTVSYRGVLSGHKLNTPHSGDDVCVVKSFGCFGWFGYRYNTPRRIRRFAEELKPKTDQPSNNNKQKFDDLNTLATLCEGGRLLGLFYFSQATTFTLQSLSSWRVIVALCSGTREKPRLRPLDATVRTRLASVRRRRFDFYIAAPREMRANSYPPVYEHHRDADGAAIAKHTHRERFSLHRIRRWWSSRRCQTNQTISLTP